MAKVFFRKPSRELVLRFLEKERDAALTYKHVGAACDAERPAGFAWDENDVRLGHGNAVFETACEALRQWKMFPAWTCVVAEREEIHPGLIAGVLIRTCGLWWLNSARIVRVVDRHDPTREFGFAYGTLPGHLECGEEYFFVTHEADDSVWYRIRAFSRPRLWITLAGYPVVRLLQKRFGRDSRNTMLRAVSAGNEAGRTAASAL